jgi:cell division protease FtsH
MPEHDPVYKVSIIPRGRALGVTMFLPVEDRYSLSRRSIISQVCSLFGGRIAEEITLGKDGVTTGASNDIERATEIARNMVTKWGLSDKMGPLKYDEGGEEVFLGRSAGMPSKAVSDDTAKHIDEEVRSIVDHCYAKAEQLLQDNLDTLHLMADALIQFETLDSDQLDSIMEGRMPDPPEDWHDGHGGSGAGAEGAEGEAGAESDASADSKDSTGPIGGPAQEH